MDQRGAHGLWCIVPIMHWKGGSSTGLLASAPKASRAHNTARDQTFLEASRLQLSMRGGLLVLMVLGSMLCSLLLPLPAPVSPRADAQVVDPPLALIDSSQGRWHLRHADGSEESFYFGNPGDAPVVGDWNGDLAPTVGMYRPSNGFFYSRDSNSPGNAEHACFAGNPNDVAISGDWNGDGTVTLGLYRPGNQTFYLYNKKCENEPMGAAEISFVFGDPGDAPLVGDLDGDGITEVALHRRSAGRVYYRLTLTTGVAEASLLWGNPGDRVFAGDWNGDGTDTVGLFRPSEKRVYLRNSNTQGVADLDFNFGQESWIPPRGTLTAPALSVGILDGDGDGFYDELELALGSAQGDATSTPEDISFPATCSNGLDDDADGSSDVADSGCTPPPLECDFLPSAGTDRFSSRMLASIDGEAVTLEGSVVVARSGAFNDPTTGLLTIDFEIVALQLSGSLGDGDVTLMEDPTRTSSGSYTAALVVDEDSSFPVDSRFDIFLVLRTPSGTYRNPLAAPFTTPNGGVSCIPPEGEAYASLTITTTGPTLDATLEIDRDDDADGVTNNQELRQGTHPSIASSDGDEFADGVDACPLDPEDADGFEDDDGCPDPNNDGDAVGDTADACPDDAEDVDGVGDSDGCPETDEDSDLVPDEREQLTDSDPSSSLSLPEHLSLGTCSDAVDNDQDGATDTAPWPGDSGCRFAVTIDDADPDTTSAPVSDSCIPSISCKFRYQLNIKSTGLWNDSVIDDLVIATDGAIPSEDAAGPGTCIDGINNDPNQDSVSDGDDPDCTPHFTITSGLSVDNDTPVGSIQFAIEGDASPPFSGPPPRNCAPADFFGPLGPSDLLDGALRTEGPPSGDPFALLDATVWPQRLDGVLDGYLTANSGASLEARYVGLGIGPTDAIPVNILVLDLEQTPVGGPYLEIIVIGDPLGDLTPLAFCNQLEADIILLGRTPTGESLRQCNVAATFTHKASASPLPPTQDKTKCQVTVDLKIHNGMKDPSTDGDQKKDAEPPNADADEEQTIGAFTVANLNDTDADSAVDKDDNTVTPNPDGRKEVDLIKLVIRKPDPAKDGKIRLTLTGDGTMTKLWKHSDKQNMEELAREFNVADIPVEGLIRWVECLDKSTAVRDIEVKIEYVVNDGGIDKTVGTDVAKVTCVWVEMTAFVNSDAQLTTLVAATTLTDADGNKIPDLVNELLDDVMDQRRSDSDGSLYGCQTFRRAADGADTVIGCRMLMEFRVFPTGIGNEHGVKFDVTRQIEKRGHRINNGTVTSPEGRSEDFPKDAGKDEKPNDDRGHRADEDNVPNNDRIYSWDAPRSNRIMANADFYIERRTFREYVRCRFDNAAFTHSGAEPLEGSRCSDREPWHMLHYLRRTAPANVSGNWAIDSADPSASDAVRSGTGNGLMTTPAATGGASTRGWAATFNTAADPDAWNTAANPGGGQGDAATGADFTSDNGEVMFKITAGPTGFANNDRFRFSVFNSTVNKTTEIAIGAITATAGP